MEFKFNLRNPFNHLKEIYNEVILGNVGLIFR